MIQANELRIGNLVCYSLDMQDFPKEIKSIVENGVDTGYRKLLNYDQIFPIQLTEEWILKFGFNGRTAFRWNGKVGIQFLDNEYYIAFKDLSNVIFHSLLKIQYVHQLQNLYFALTQTELELKQI